ncbi:MAG: hypothetical protein M3O70_18625 [Actinomycetota bacterium]|nr:hypothetical protein [Actinomycetota bacterium]
MTPPLVSSSLRVYTEVPPADPVEVPPSPFRRAGPPPVEHIMVVDFETTTDLAQRLTFGSARHYRITRKGTTVTARERREWLIFADDLPQRDPDGYATLVDYARDHRIKLRSLSQWLRSVMWKATHDGAYVVGYNLPFDLSRMAWQWGAARRGVRGFTLNLWGYHDAKTDRRRQSLYRPRARVRQLGPHSRSMELSNPPRGDAPLGGLLDVSQLVFALTDRRHRLSTACDAFGCEIGKGDPGRHGVITDDYITYNRRDVAATGELLAAALTELETRWPGLHPTRAYTPASLGRSALAGFGLTPTRQRWPNWPVELNGEAMAAYFGGRAEVRIRRTPVPVVVCDFLSQYPTACALLGVWRLLTSKEMRAVECAGWLGDFLERVARDGPSMVLDPEVWPAMVGFAKVVCDGDVAVPVRAAYSERCDGPVDHRTAASILTADEPCVYSIPDLVASVLLTGRVPEIVSSWRLEGDGRAEGMAPLDVEGIGRINPYRDDPYVRWIELRKRIDADLTRPKHERGRLTRALKIVANATAYGLLVQCTKKDGEPGDLVVATDDSVEQHHVAEVEQFGNYAFPPLGALITAGGRLLLAIAERLVTDLGGTFAFCDTDSMAIVATPEGGPVPCEGGPVRMPDGEDAVLALSHAQVMDDVVGAFDRLNPYNPAIVGGSILEVEDYCRTDKKWPVGADNLPRSITCYAISSKRYVLYHEDETGERHLVKPTEHGLGRYLIPQTADEGRPVDRVEWYRSVLQWALARDLDGDETPPDWAHRIAVAKLPIQPPIP